MELDQYEDIMHNYPFTLMTKPWNPTYPGPLLDSKVLSGALVPDKVKDAVQNSQRLRSFLDAVRMYTNESEVKRALEVVKSILLEIGMDRSMLTIRGFGLLIEYMVRKVHLSLFINRSQVERIKAKAPSNPVIYLPTHRSYADFILFSFLCFYNDMEVPQVAAGMDFKNMKVVGKLMSKAGAFYMQRSFAEDKLYWNVFKEFIRNLVIEYGSGLEFFIEGTRSRTMKALTPKIGLLSMALEPFFMGQVVDITIIPVSVSYERPLEEQLFAYELLGVPKPKESTLGLLKSMSALGNKYYGSTYVHYHEPLSVKEFFGERANRFQHAHEPAHVQQLTKGELEMVQELAQHVIDQQQRFIVIHAFNLMAIYLSYRSQVVHTDTKIDIPNVCEQVLILGRLFGRLGATTNVNPALIRQQLMDTLKTHEELLELTPNGGVELKKRRISTSAMKAVHFKAHRLGDDTMTDCLPWVGLQLYVNPCLYWTAMPALTLASVRRLFSSRCIVESVTVGSLREEVRYWREVFGTEFVFPPFKDDEDFARTLDQLKDFNLIDVNGELVVVPSKSEEASVFGDVLISTVTPYLWSYFHVLKTIAARFPNVEFTEKDCGVAVQCSVEKILREEGQFVHPYCLSLETICTAIRQFLRLGVLAKRKHENGCAILSAVLPKLHSYHSRLHHFCSAQGLKFSHHRAAATGAQVVKAKL